MKKNTVFSIAAILLCFLIGYTAYQATALVATIIESQMSDCDAGSGDGCNQNNENPFAAQRRR